MTDTPVKTKPMKDKEWDKLDVPIEHLGRAITLPADPGRMPIKKAMEALARKLADEEQPFNVHEIIDAYPHDAAVAFVKAMANLYGWASPKSTMGFFGPNPPTMMSVKTGPHLDDVIQCPIGAFELPGVDSEVNTTIHRGKFIIHTTVKKKDRHLVLELANETRRIVRESSIYKGKALHLLVNDDGDLIDDVPPDFLDVSDITESNLLFDDTIQDQINTNILSLVVNLEAAKAIKVPVKRTVLLEGPYGTGKTLLTRLIASVATGHNWTFILLNRIQGLKNGLEFAKAYAPAIVVGEDVDRICEERDDKMNDLTITIDGVISKTTEVMTILTTNHVEKIHPVMRRQGRIDHIIPLRAPGAATVEKLLRYYAGDLLAPDAPLLNASVAMAGQIPSSIRECVEQAKLAMLWRKDTMLNDSDLVISAHGMQNHLEYMKDPKSEPSDADQLADSLKKVIGNGNTDHLVSIENQLRRVVRTVC